ncbi:MAG TPA: RidA family protein, partial [Anaerolineales bacterium]|nr:RidA family protein [Anaerolineales bacterium]
MKEFRNPQDIHRPVGSYSHQIEIRGNERLLVLSGQVGMREDGTVPDDPLEQIEVAFENIFRNLRAAGMDVKDLIKITYYLVGEIDTAKRREVILSKLQGHQPCSTLLYVAGLASPLYQVEIDAWASRAQ